MNPKRDLRWYKTSFRISLVGVIIFALMFGFLWHKGNYTDKLMKKIGVSTQQEDPQNKPDYWAVRSWENCLNKLDVDVDVAFFGDSITYGGNFQEYFTDLKCINLGYLGDSLVGFQNRVDMLADVSPEIVFVMGGD